MINPRYLVTTTATPLIGRSAHLTAIDQLITRIEAGEPGPHTLLISGEAGTGKSRLQTALQERVRQRWNIYEVACFEPYQHEPYAPLTDLLVRALEGLAEEQRALVLGNSAQVLAILPGLEYLAPAGASPPVPDIAQNQRRLFQALTEFFGRLASMGPLLIAIEDIHWSDAATLAFLPILAHAIAARAVLLVLTYRADELPPQLATALAEMDRRRLAFELSLACFSPAEVDAQLRALVGLKHAPPPALLDKLYTLTDGNPFFVEELVSSILASGVIDPASGVWLQRPIADLPTPRSVQEAVRRRSSDLSPAAHELLMLAAALGRRFDFALLQKATGRDETELLGLLKELIATRLLVEEAPDQFAFRHALGRAAIYGGLLSRERRALHRRLAEALEPSATEVHAADLAQHFLRGELWEKALHYSRVAAEQAQRLNAQREGVVHLTVALEAAAHLPGTPQTELLLARSAAYQLLGDFDTAHADSEAALDDAQARSHAIDEWKALLRLGMLWVVRDYRRAGEYFARTLEQARTLGEPALLAHSLNQVGNWHMNQERPCTAIAMHSEALDIFEELEDLPAQADTLVLLGTSYFFAADLANERQAMLRASELRQAMGDTINVYAIAGRLLLRYYVICDAPDFVSLAEHTASLDYLLQIFKQNGWRGTEAASLQVLGSHYFEIGEFGRAYTCLRESIAIGEEIGYHEWLAYALGWMALLMVELNEPAEAADWATRAQDVADAIRSPFVKREIAAGQIRAYVAHADLAQADAILSAALQPTGEPPEPSLLLRRVQLAGAELSLARGLPEQALKEVEFLIATANNPVGSVIPALWYMRGQALAALRRYDEANLVLQEAYRAAQAGYRRPLVSRIIAALAGVAIAQRRTQAAEQLLGEARATIDLLAATISDEQLREGYQRRAYANLPQLPAVTPRQAVKQVFGGLTDRELDVARLVARGYTNRQIADALVLSERTVTTHIGHILSKLGFSSRAQVARWVTEKGLVR